RTTLEDIKGTVEVRWSQWISASSGWQCVATLAPWLAPADIKEFLSESSGLRATTSPSVRRQRCGHLRRLAGIGMHFHADDAQRDLVQIRLQGAVELGELRPQ